MYKLCQWVAPDKKIHEDEIEETDINVVLDTYESLFLHLGFNAVVSVNHLTQLPLLKIKDNDKLKATLFFERA
jgi:hypothetical protein